MGDEKKDNRSSLEEKESKGNDKSKYDDDSKDFKLQGETYGSLSESRGLSSSSVSSKKSSKELLHHENNDKGSKKYITPMNGNKNDDDMKNFNLEYEVENSIERILLEKKIQNN